MVAGMSGGADEKRAELTIIQKSNQGFGDGLHVAAEKRVVSGSWN